MALLTMNTADIQTNPGRFFNNVIREYVATCANNIMPGFEGEPIWDEPLVGFADGDDSIFQEYKTIISPFHLTPREAMEKHLKKIAGGYPNPAHISVVSFILPSTSATRKSMRKETEVCSLRWNYTRHYGQEVINRLSRYLVSTLEAAGHHAFVPDQEKFYEVKGDDPAKRVSNWSQRHIAYAAGLGTFSLNDALITPKGIAIRIGSIVCDLEIKPTPRPYKSHLENCLFYQEGTCRKCILRCPVGALSDKGHDKSKCRNYMYEGMPKVAGESGRKEAFVGGYWGCGFCQTGVPCEGRIPTSKKNKS